MKTLKASVVALAIAVSSSLFVAPNAEAGIAIGKIDFNYLCTYNCSGASGLNVFFAAVGCLLVLPICLIGDEQKVNKPADVVFSTSDLVNQKGYSEADARQILIDFRAHESLLAATGLSYVPEASETRVQIVNDIRGIYPQASDVYIQFLLESAGY